MPRIIVVQFSLWIGSNAVDQRFNKTWKNQSMLQQKNPFYLISLTAGETTSPAVCRSCALCLFDALGFHHLSHFVCRKVLLLTSLKIWKSDSPFQVKQDNFLFVSCVEWMFEGLEVESSHTCLLLHDNDTNWNVIVLWNEHQITLFQETAREAHEYNQYEF